MNEARRTRRTTSIAVHVPSYLSISATFVYRQLRGVTDGYRPIVFTGRVRNREKFPYDQICSSVPGPVEALMGKLVRRLQRRYALLAPSQYRYWKEVLQKERVQLIHAHFGPAGLQMLPLARESGIPLLVTFHGADASSLLENAAYRRQLQDLFSYASIIVVSETVREALLRTGASPKQLTLHYIGVPREMFRCVDRTPLKVKVERGERIDFLQVANMVEKKGHVYTLEAYARLRQVYPAARLIFAGDGPLRPTIESKCRRLGIEDSVVLCGRVTSDEAVRYMHRADAFLHHSVTAASGDREGLPTVILEAMSTGLPVVSTFHAGIPEAVRDRDTGHLVPERDVDQYTERLLDLLDEGGTMGRRATEAVRERFDMTAQNSELKRIYGAMIGPDTARGV